MARTEGLVRERSEPRERRVCVLVLGSTEAYHGTLLPSTTLAMPETAMQACRVKNTENAKRGVCVGVNVRQVGQVGIAGLLRTSLAWPAGCAAAA